ncbi:MAG: hypothetical protein JWR69_3227 [Pedosphaera sp.]|nr:hypothetical protein [Pedosphaera sp.]
MRSQPRLPIIHTTGAIADSQLSGNVARLNGNATFTGTLTAGGFSGNGAGLTNITAASPGAVLKANNGSDFADTVATANHVGVRVIPGPDFYPNMLNTTPAFAGQLALAQNGGSYPFLYNALSTNQGDWLGSFRFQGICQFGDRTRMRLNYSRAQYSFFINGYTNQTDDTAGNNVIVLENEHTNHYSAITFQFSPLNNYNPQGEGGSIGVGNCGTPAAFSNALYLHAAGVPINFTMAGRSSGSAPQDLIAYFDYPTSDFHYIDRNGNQAFTIRANDGRVSVAGTLTAGVFVGDGSGLTNLNTSGGGRVLYTNAAGVNINVNGQLSSYSTIILTNSGAPCGVSLPNPTIFDGVTRTIKMLGPAANAITTNNGGSFGDVGLPGELGNPPNYFVPDTNTAYTFCAAQGKWWVVGKF